MYDKNVFNATLFFNFLQMKWSHFRENVRAVGCCSALTGSRQIHPHNQETEKQARIYGQGSDF